MSLTKPQAIRVVHDIKNLALAAKVDNRATKEKLVAALTHIAADLAELERKLNDA